MTKSQLHVKQICLPSLILNVRNNEKNHHYADIMIRNFHISHNASGVRDFMARNCLANGLRAQAVGYKRIQERLLAYLIFFQQIRI